MKKENLNEFEELISLINKRIDSFLDFLEKKTSYENLDDFTKKVYEKFKSKIKNLDYEKEVPALFDTFYGGCFMITFEKDYNNIMFLLRVPTKKKFNSVKSFYEEVGGGSNPTLRNIFERFYKSVALGIYECFEDEEMLSFEEFKENLKKPIKHIL